jgi:hypothetical protein
MCQMSTAGGRREPPEGANYLIMAGLTGVGRLAIVWYTYCTFQESVGMCHRNILLVSDVWLGKDTQYCPGGLGFEPRLLEGLLNGE